MELTERDGGTRLTLRHRAQGPEWLPKVAAGWHIRLDVADRLLDGDRGPHLSVSRDPSYTESVNKGPFLSPQHVRAWLPARRWA